MVRLLLALCVLLIHDLPAVDPDWITETAATEQMLKVALAQQVANGRPVTLAVDVLGTPGEGRVETVRSEGPVMITSQGLGLQAPWSKLLPAAWITMAELEGSPTHDMRHRLVRLLIHRGWVSEAERELGRIDSSAIDADGWRQTCAALAAVKPAPRPAEPVKPAARTRPAEAATPKESRPGRPGAIRASDAQSRILRQLERDHFLFGFNSTPRDPWLDEVRGQGAAIDIRYQYICGGVNTASNWKTWDQPAGAFASNYINATPQGVIPMFTYYQMRQSAPGGAEETAAVRANSASDATMRAYFDDWLVLMQACAKAGRPVIVHWEPDFSGFVQAAPEFGHDPARVRIAVASSGHPAATGLPDSLAGLCAALVRLRDQTAPNVLLGCHLSQWGQGDGMAAGAFVRSLGKGWDMVVVDPSDRDAAWRVAKGYHVEGAWWDQAGFDRFRNWCAGIHEAAGLPVMLWQVPMGNTIMAACNDTEGHYQDNRAQHWLEDYPRNRNMQAWAEAGVFAICFGAGAGGCTITADGCKDGVTNPTPAKGNRGEKSTVPDDDGGYLRLRLAAYAKAGGLPFTVGKVKERR
jgi:hypothetical protein